MKNTNIIDALTAQVTLQSVASTEIMNNTSTKFKNYINKSGVNKFLAGLALVAAGLSNVHANPDEARNIAIVGSGIVGMVVNGVKDLPPECANVQGMNGWNVGGGGAAGGLFGSLFGQGDGKSAMTYLGAGTMAAIQAGKENERMRNECNRILAQIQQERNRNSQNQSQNYRNNNENTSPPQYSGDNRVNANVLYSGRTTDGKRVVVTFDDSPGIKAMQGKNSGNVPVESDVIVQKALTKSSALLIQKYESLEKETERYASIINGKDSAGKLARYAVSDDEISEGQKQQNISQEKIRQATNAYNNALSKYMSQRTNTANIFDNAALDGFNLSSYSHLVEYMITPDVNSYKNTNNKKISLR